MANQIHQLNTSVFPHVYVFIHICTYPYICVIFLQHICKHIFITAISATDLNEFKMSSASCLST